MPTYDEPALGRAVVLRRQPARIAEGRVQGAYADAFEIICDHPDRDYRDASLELQRVRGPYSFAGITAYLERMKLYDGEQSAHGPGRAVRGPDGGSACAGSKGGHD